MVKQCSIELMNSLVDEQSSIACSMAWADIRKELGEVQKPAPNKQSEQSLCDTCEVKVDVCDNPQRGNVFRCDDYV